MIDGILVINKPPGLTSHDVVNRVRRITGQRHTGHAGTLDPLATGVLVVCLGQATRLAEYLVAGRKTYCAQIVLGVSTDTDDAEGRVTQVAPVTATLDDVQAALDGFRGEIAQIPPVYSAIKQGGRPLYRAARAGEEVIVAPRQVTIYDLRLIAYAPPALVIHVTCSKGTYIRSLARDLGQVLGCGGHLGALVRLQSGRFTLDEAITLDDLALAVEHEYVDRFLYPPDEALLDTFALLLGAEKEKMIGQGKGLPVSGLTSAGLCRAYNLAGEFLAVGQLDLENGWWQPEKVFKPCN